TTRLSFLLLYFSIPLSRPLSSTLFPYTTLFRSEFHRPRDWVAARLFKGSALGNDRVEKVVELFGLLFVHLGAHGVTDYPAEATRSEEHTSELQSRFDLVCRLLLETKN